MMPEQMRQGNSKRPTGAALKHVLPLQHPASGPFAVTLCRAAGGHLWNRLAQKENIL